MDSFKLVERAGHCPVASPVGTAVDSPPFQRWDEGKSNLVVPEGRLQRASAKEPSPGTHPLSARPGHPHEERVETAKTGHERGVLERQSAATDGEIDRLVYELYGLSEEEIAIVEGKP